MRESRHEVGSGGLEQRLAFALVLATLLGTGVLGVLVLLPKLAAVTAQF